MTISFWKFIKERIVIRYSNCYHCFDKSFWQNRTLKEIFFPWHPYLKTDGTSLLILFLVKNFEEKKKYNFWKNGSVKNFRQILITTGLLAACFNSKINSFLQVIVINFPLQTNFQKQKLRLGSFTLYCQICCMSPDNYFFVNFYPKGNTSSLSKRREGNGQGLGTKNGSRITLRFQRTSAKNSSRYILWVKLFWIRLLISFKHTCCVWFLFTL